MRDHQLSDLKERQLLESAKSLAYTIRVVQKELDKFEKRVDRKLEGNLLKESAIHEEYLSDLKSTLIEQVLSEITILGSDDSSVAPALKKTEQSLNKKIYDVDQRINEEVNRIALQMREASQSSLSQDQELEESLNEFVSHFKTEITDTSTAINTEIEALKQALVATEQALQQHIAETARELSSRIDTEGEERKVQVYDTQVTIEQFKTEFSTHVNNYLARVEGYDTQWEDQLLANQQLSAAITAVDEYASKLNTRVGLEGETNTQEHGEFSEQLRKQDEAIGKLNRTKSDTEHNHDSVYSKVDHDHGHLATKSEVKLIRDTSNTNEQKIGMIDQILNRVSNEVNKKLDKQDALSKDDLDDLVARLKAEVLEELPVPKDGKDGLEWEFKFHDMHRGVLLYRRSDWSEWKSQNLMGPVQQIDTGGGFGGGGSVASDEPTEFYYKATVAADGSFFVDVNVFDFFTELRYFDCHSTMLQNETLPPEQRFIETQIDTIDASGIKGYAYIERNSRSLIGTINKTLVPAPEGTVVYITVIGERF